MGVALFLFVLCLRNSVARLVALVASIFIREKYSGFQCSGRLIYSSLAAAKHREYHQLPSAKNRDIPVLPTLQPRSRPGASPPPGIAQGIHSTAIGL